MFCHFYPLIVLFILILHLDTKRALQEGAPRNFLANFGRSKISPLAERESERGRKWPFLSQNCIFGHLDPPNCIFRANFASWLQEGNPRKFLSQVRRENNFFLCKGDSERGQKWQFSSQDRTFGHFDPLDGIFMLILHPDLNKTIIEIC